MRILHRYKKNPCNVQYSIDGGGIEYGLLYNWYAATDERNIASDGWYIPSKAEMDGLVTHLGGASVAGGKLKETGMTYWKSPNTGATNEVGFNGRGGGKRNPSLSFNSLNIETLIMSSTTGGVNYHYLYLTSNSSQATTSNIFTFKGGSSIRLVSDATGVADGTTTTYVGNDGKVYKAIAINGLYWLAENLAETKYRNGNIIPEVTDNTEWGNLTTGALCAYENDWNYVETTSDPNVINYALISGELPITVELIGNTTHTNNHIILESGSFTDIPGGTYTFKVTDALGCEESEIIEIPYSEPIALNSSYDIDRKTLETCTVFKGFDYTVFGFTGETMFDRVKITSVPTNGTLSRGLLDTILVNDELIYPSDFNNGLYYRTSSIEKVDYSDTIGFQVRVNGLWSNTATITINVNSCIFADDCIEYGYLYNWYAATDVRSIANTGWHVPNKVEFETLLSYVGGSSIASRELKEIGTLYWKSNNGLNTYNFNSRGAGFRGNTGGFAELKRSNILWTTLEYDAINACHLIIQGVWDSTNFNLTYPKVAGDSIRLLKDSTTLSHGETGVYVGNDGKIYPTICIGTQEWVASNLAETQYSNGDPIPTVEDNTTWAGLTTGAKCAYDNNYSFVGCDETAPTIPSIVETMSANIEFNLLVDAELNKPPVEQACFMDDLVFETILDFTPASTWYGGTHVMGSNIVEDSNYIYLALNDSYTGDYIQHVLLAYNKNTGVITSKKLQFSNFSDYHKIPTLLVTNSGALIYVTEKLLADGAHNGEIAVARWSNPENINSYTITTIGNGSTERLAYPFIFEVNGEIIIEARRYTSRPPYRVYYKSSNDGVSFGSMTQYLNYGTNNYWIFSGQVGNQAKGEDVVLGITPAYYPSRYTIYKYITFLRTDFSTGFYSIGGTDLGTDVSRTELENNRSGGVITEDSTAYFARHSKIFGDYIYTIYVIGTRTSIANYTDMQIIRIHKTTGVLEEGTPFTTVLPSTSLEYTQLYSICGEIGAKISNGGTISYYLINSDLNGITLYYQETGSYHTGFLSDVYSELTADYNTFTKKLRVFRMPDPDTATLYVPPTTTTTTTIP